MRYQRRWIGGREDGVCLHLYTAWTSKPFTSLAPYAIPGYSSGDDCDSLSVEGVPIQEASLVSDDIPFTEFHGRIKQLETAFNFPVMREFFEPSFSAFNDLDEHYAALKRQGIHRVVTAAGVEFNFGYRPRRFSGGPGLPPGSYFSLCDDDTFNDHGTLRDEITAYYSGLSGNTVTVFDPTIEKYVLDHLEHMAGMSAEDLAYPLYYFKYRIERRTTRNAALFERENPFTIGQHAGITYGVRQFAGEVDRIIDLRNPETQQWFLETFVALELENEGRAADEARIIFPKKEPIASFGELLKVIVSLETGGGMIFGQAVGHWLRQHGARGLIFPSARSNAFNKARNGVPVEWGGWNFVDYADAEPPVPVNLFGGMGTWRDRDHDHIHVDYTADGPNQGSFSIRGAREFNLLDFDLKKRVACGLLEESIEAELTGVRNEAISREVNRILERERLRRTIWYEDTDYMGFVTRLEEGWRNLEPKKS
jgi:hypothetical protein